MSAHWKQQRERASPRAVALAVRLALLLGRTPARLLLAPVVLYFFLCSPALRRSSRAYLTRALGRPPRAWDSLKQLYAFAACTLDRVFLMAGRGASFEIRAHDPGELLRHAAGQRGSLVLVSHLGSFDVLRVLGRERKGLRFAIVMDRAHGEATQSALERVNPAEAPEVIDANDGPLLAMRIKEALDRGLCVGLMADRVRNSAQAATVEFLGAPAAFPADPWALAAVLGVPVILCFGLYRGGRRYDLHLEKFAERVEAPRAQRAAAVQAHAQRYAGRLAHYARQAPYNWFNFYDYWNDEAAAG